MRFSRTSTAWLGGTVRRWIALMGSLATLAGTVAFAITEHIAWAWLAIVALLLLAVSLATELWKVQRAQTPLQEGMLDRAVADGRALLTLHDGSGYQWQEWREWRKVTSTQLRQHVGLKAVYDFEKAADPKCPQGERITAQLAVLEALKAGR